MRGVFTPPHNKPRARMRERDEYPRLDGSAQSMDAARPRMGGNAEAATWHDLSHFLCVMSVCSSLDLSQTGGLNSDAIFVARHEFVLKTGAESRGPRGSHPKG